MVQRIRKQDIKVTTQQGEVDLNITLEINLNLNTEGMIVSASGVEAKAKKIKKEEKEESPYLVPDFTMGKVDFGKKVEE
jgi:indole-3-glycerol phosphate synthase